MIIKNSRKELMKDAGNAPFRLYFHHSMRVIIW